ncbi:MAG: hypothetical protein ACU84Q_21265, partial [Gammaproteobacteria bacterium]
RSALCGVTRCSEGGAGQVARFAFFVRPFMAALGYREIPTECLLLGGNIPFRVAPKRRDGCAKQFDPALGSTKLRQGNQRLGVAPRDGLEPPT